MVVVLISVTAMCGWLLVTHRTFFVRDLSTTHRPAALVFQRIHLATLNPFASFGQSYVGNPNELVTYPFPKVGNALSVQIICHMILAACGMVALLRRLSVSVVAALFGSCAFVMSGYVLSATASLNSITTIGWIPFVLWSGVVCARTQHVTREIVCAVGSLALLSLAGEPVLATLAVVLATMLAAKEGGVRGALSFAACVAAAGLLTLPIHLAVARAAADSARVLLGFTAQHAMSESLHPARLVEIPFPFFFGDSSRLIAGGWWGYKVSDGTLPYVSSVSVGIVPLLFVLALACATRLRQYRFWWLVLAVSLVLACSGYVPGVTTVYDVLRPLHVVRFPIKFYLFVTLAIATLAAFAFDELASAGVIVRRHVVLLFSGVIAAFLMGAALVQQSLPRIARWIVTHLWDAAWRSSPDEVLRPILTSLAARCVVVAAVTFCCLIWVGRRRGAAGHIAVILLVVSDSLATVRSLMPTVNLAVYERRSPLVMAAQSLHGRIYERTEKDLTPVVFGLRGRYAADDVRELAAVQARQAWPLAGVAFGLRYAYDQCPDGSYTARNQIMEDLVSGADWPRRIKWLRAAGVAGVISSNVPPDTPGLRIVYREPASSTGIPTALYEVAARLPEVRRIRNAVRVRTPAEAVRVFESAGFDPFASVVVEGPVPNPTADSNLGSARIVRDSPDRIEIETSGSASAVLFVTRSYTLRTVATVNGAEASVYPANVHLIGIPVSRGRSMVVLTWN
jgi:hypothetical protein